MTINLGILSINELQMLIIEIEKEIARRTN